MKYTVESSVSQGMRAGAPNHRAGLHAVRPSANKSATADEDLTERPVPEVMDKGSSHDLHDGACQELAVVRGGFALMVAIAVTLSCPFREAFSADLNAAQAQFQSSCGACHAAEVGAPGRQGPNLVDRFGKAAGTLEGFNYSEALRTSNFAWDAVTLDRWITDSQAMRPGVLMSYRQADPAKRRLIIDYLESLSDSRLH